MSLGEDEKVLRVERIRTGSEDPDFLYPELYPSDLGKKISIRDLTIHPILNILEKKCKVKIERGSQIIEATIADSRVASLLDVMTGSPLLKIERTVFDMKDRPVEYHLHPLPLGPLSLHGGAGQKEDRIKSAMGLPQAIAFLFLGGRNSPSDLGQGNKEFQFFPLPLFGGKEEGGDYF